MQNERKMNTRIISATEVIIIVLLACIPLFSTFPYRVNIFLSWEGAYRMSQGQLPFRDFGLPLGGMYWVIPAIFFKIFGPQMITLIKAQVFINVLSGLAFRSILKNCKIEPGIRIVSVFLYCISFSFFNFWPWYNHTVVVYEFISLAFILKIFNTNKLSVSVLWVVSAALFTCFSFFTKQDAGGMTFMISMAVLIYYAWINKKWLIPALYISLVIVIGMLMVLPFLKYGFGYWFNHGQPPHTARISIGEILDEFFSASQWIKFYLFIILILLLVQYKSWRFFWAQKRDQLFLILTLCILGEAAVFQVTSYTPPDNNIFFHSFAIALILTLLSKIGISNFNSRISIFVMFAGIMLWWSGVYWKYIQRVTDRIFPQNNLAVSPTGENIVNRKTYMIYQDTTDIPMSKWVYSGLKSFEKIYMPEPTVLGIKRLLAMDLVKNNPGKLKVLNMSELTPLAVEMPYKLETGPDYPLWDHLGVAMFNKQAAIFENKIANKEYDLVLFEYIPALNNFYPFRIRDSLMSHYLKIDSFMAPRRGETKGSIEIYVKPAN
ncbi:MAG: hypothetical protein JSU05_05230 [Bacteroidetes bacterium]|nr:hypothetical protein [Bacteroidota bacterium]